MFFNNQAMLTAQVGYGLGLTNRLRNNAIYSSGLYVNLNKNYKPRQIDLGTPADRPVDKPHTHAATGSCYNCGAVVDTDCDGITDAIDKCPTVPGLAIHDGCPPVTMTDRDKDGIADSIDACPDAAGTMANMGCPANVVTTPPSLPAPIVAPAPAPIAVPTPAPPAPVVAPAPVTPVTSNTDQTPRFIIHFNFDRYNLTYNAIKILDAAVQYLKKNSEMKAYLYGHSDLYGANQYNVTLSLNRVNMARDYMINKGIKASRILTDHLGKTQPALSTMDKSIGWKNRRVEITVAK
jgi:outer membrane protein OmpA-like peptidoglycan-associated protein